MTRFTDRDRAAALAEARAHLADDPHCQPDQTLKIGDDSLVLSGRFSDQPAVFKWFTGANAAQTVTSTQAELAAVAPRMSNGPLQINRCLAARPDLGVIVLSFAPGDRLTSVLAQADAPTRQALIQQSGAWLSVYVGDRHRQASFGPGHWLDRLQSRRVPRHDADRLAALMASLRTISATLRGTPVTQAATHGDFAAINLHYANGTLTGVDVQGTAWLPLSRDVAKFLVWAAIHCPTPGPTLCGVPRADLAAILKTSPLPLPEAETTLPFFIGTQLYGRLLENHKHSTRGDITRRAITDFLNWRSRKESNPQPAD